MIMNRLRYALFADIPGLRFFLNDGKGNVTPYERGEAEAVMRLHEKLFGYTLKVQPYRPRMKPYTAFDTGDTFVKLLGGKS